MQWFFSFILPIGWIFRLFWKLLKRYGWLMVLVVYLLRGPLFSKRLADVLERQIAQKTGMEVQIERVSGTYFTGVSIHNIKLNKPHGPLQHLNIQEIGASYNPLAPLLGQRILQEIHVYSPEIKIQSDRFSPSNSTTEVSPSDPETPTTPTQQPQSILENIDWQTLVQNSPNLDIRDANLSVQHKDRQLEIAQFNLQTSPREGNVAWDQLLFQDKKKSRSLEKLGIRWQYENGILRIVQAQIKVPGYPEPLVFSRALEVDLRQRRISLEKFEIPLPGGGVLAGKMNWAEGCFLRLDHSEIAIQELDPVLEILDTSVPITPGYLHTHLVIALPQWDMAQLQGKLGIAITKSHDPILWQTASNESGLEIEFILEDLSILSLIAQQMFPQTPSIGGSLRIQQATSINQQQQQISSTGRMLSQQLTTPYTPASDLALQWNVRSNWNRSQLWVDQLTLDFLHSRLAFQCQMSKDSTQAWKGKCKLTGAIDNLQQLMQTLPIQNLDCQGRLTWEIEVSQCRWKSQEEWDIQGQLKIILSQAKIDWGSQKFYCDQLIFRAFWDASQKQLTVSDWEIHWNDVASVNGKLLLNPQNISLSVQWNCDQIEQLFTQIHLPNPQQIQGKTKGNISFQSELLPLIQSNWQKSNAKIEINAAWDQGKIAGRQIPKIQMAVQGTLQQDGVSISRFHIGCDQAQFAEDILPKIQLTTQATISAKEISIPALQLVCGQGKIAGQAIPKIQVVTKAMIRPDEISIPSLQVWCGSVPYANNILPKIQLAMQATIHPNEISIPSLRIGCSQGQIAGQVLPKIQLNTKATIRPQEISIPSLHIVCDALQWSGQIIPKIQLTTKAVIRPDIISVPGLQIWYGQERVVNTQASWQFKQSKANLQGKLYLADIQPYVILAQKIAASQKREIPGMANGSFTLDWKLEGKLPGGLVLIPSSFIPTPLPLPLASSRQALSAPHTTNPKNTIETQNILSQNLASTIAITSGGIQCKLANGQFQFPEQPAYPFQNIGLDIQFQADQNQVQVARIALAYDQRVQVQGKADLDFRPQSTSNWQFQITIPELTQWREMVQLPPDVNIQDIALFVEGKGHLASPVQIKNRLRAELRQLQIKQQKFPRLDLIFEGDVAPGTLIIENFQIQEPDHWLVKCQGSLNYDGTQLTQLDWHINTDRLAQIAQTSFMPQLKWQAHSEFSGNIQGKIHAAQKQADVALSWKLPILPLQGEKQWLIQANEMQITGTENYIPLASPPPFPIPTKSQPTQPEISQMPVSRKSGFYGQAKVQWNGEQLRIVGEFDYFFPKIAFQDWMIRDLQGNIKLPESLALITMELNALVGGSWLQYQGQITHKDYIPQEFSLHVYGERILVLRTQELYSRANLNLHLAGKIQPVDSHRLPLSSTPPLVSSSASLATSLAVVPSQGALSSASVLSNTSEPSQATFSSAPVTPKSAPTWHTTAKLSGKIEFTELNIQTSMSLQSAPERVQMSPSFEMPGLDLELALELLFPQIRMKNNLLDITTQGKLDIQGNTAQPQIQGYFQTKSGKLFLPQGLMMIRECLVRFQPDYPLLPSIYVKAETNVRDYRVQVLIQGRWPEINIEFSSVPPLSQEDILMLLMTGATREELQGNTSEKLKETGSFILMQQFLNSVGLGDYVSAQVTEESATITVTPPQWNGFAVQGKVTRGGGMRLRFIYRVEYK